MNSTSMFIATKQYGFSVLPASRWQGRGGEADRRVVAAFLCDRRQDAGSTLNKSTKRVRAAFTLVEVLAALAFMAIVIPVAVDGLRIANRAGQVGQRKAVAARIAERVLNEVVITGQFRSTTQSGTVQEGVQAYQWFMRSEPWPMDAMLLVTVQVNFPVQGREFDVRLSTLVDNSTQ
jgi:type II secretory pathway pseudopilin PulG